MKHYITIDGGTTNTRIALYCKEGVKELVRIPLGAKAGIDHRSQLISSIEKGIRGILEKYPEISVECILVSGMLTCEFGLCQVDHIAAPAGIAELHVNLHRSELAGLPCCYIPGVKKVSPSFEEVDMMRGEETELIGILSVLPEELVRDSAIVLPGSHSKIIYTDTEKRIADFHTLLTGEMIAALSQNTILKDAVSLEVEGYDPEYLFQGYEYCRKAGMNQALFKVRILKNLFGVGGKETYSFFLGIVLEPEIRQLLECGKDTVILAGKKQIKEPEAELLQRVSHKKVVVLEDAMVQHATFAGMVHIYKKSDTFCCK